MKSRKPGIQLKDEDMVDSWWAPAVHVDPHEEEEENDQEGTAVQPHHHPPVVPKKKTSVMHIYRQQVWAGLQIPVLWNRNYFLRFRFRLLKSYGSGSDFRKS